MNTTFFLRGLAVVTLAMAIQGPFLFAQKSQQVNMAEGRKLLLGSISETKTSTDILQQKADDVFYFVAHAAQPTLLQQAVQSGQLKVVTKLSDATYLVSSKQSPTQTSFSTWGIDAAGALKPELKLSKKLADANIPAHAKTSGNKVQLLIGTMPTANAMKLLIQAGFQPEISPINQWHVYNITCSISDINTLATLPFVAFVQPVPPPDKKLNQSSRSMSRGSSLAAPIVNGGRNLSGSGVTVGVGDDADPTLHPDLFDRILNHTPGIVNDHGAHVTGTVGGAGIILPQRTGFAPQANIVSQWFSGVWQNAASYVQDYNMVVTNNSYGNIAGECGWAGTYDLLSQILDQQAFDFPQLLHVFASGNDGDLTCSPFPQRYATVLSGLQSAKNVITTGRTDYVQLASGSSSSGPVKDGRLKPEIVALGEAILSTKGFFNINDAYWGAWGTSMAAPAITGGLALLYERYKQLNGAQNPNGALMKALLLNGARDIGTAGPDFRNGYGMMHLENSLRMLENHNYKQAAIQQSQVHDTVITVPPGTAQLKVMLYWHDPAANVLASKTLVNDIDLTVIAPSGSTVLPLTLNANPASVANTATPGTDHINNSEQIVIDNPAPGSYTIRTRGYDVMVASPQAYAVAFDYVPLGIAIQVPFKGEVWSPTGATIPVSWDYNGASPNPFTLEYSLDDGINWTTINNNIASNLRFFDWTQPTSLTTTALLRITKNGTSETFTTGGFSFIAPPAASLAPVAEQCPGYIKMNWNAIAGADGYDIILKQGPTMKTIGTVAAGITTFTIAGLSADSTYYASVRAIKNNQRSRWNTPVERKPNSGSCTGSISDGDLALDSIASAVTGRQFTASALTASNDMRIRIKNLDDANASAFEIKYSINGAAFVTQAISTSVAAGSTYTHTFNGINLLAIGDYQFIAVVKNTAAVDANAANDTFRTIIRHLPNPTIALATPYIDGFENATIENTNRRTTGVAGTTAWDFASADVYGRIRTRPFANNANNGNRSVTLDVSKATPMATNPINYLSGTFNLSNYTTAQEVRFDFWYKHHGVAQASHPQNKVWARGSETDPWIEVYDLGTNQLPIPGMYQRVRSIELSDVFNTAVQQFGTATQVRFGQYGLYSAADKNRFAGYTFDDVRFYIATNDVQILSIDRPFLFSCGLTASTPIRMQVRNSMSTALNNIPVSYSINGGTVVNEIIATIAANTTVDYTFATAANLAVAGPYNIVAQANMPGDNVAENNEATATVTNQPIISSFPYLENFETNAGNWFTAGINNSWQYGTPRSRTITKAASGSKAWKTSLIGNYNDNERSYLYSPCFNINSMTSPTLSFAMAYDMEDCSPYNVVCDAVWVEYSYDGVTWQKLGTAGSGTNWYDNASFQVWLSTNKTHWHVATTPLPKQAGNISLRMVLQSDDGVNREGVAIDDIHIFDNTLPIFTGPTNTGPINQTLTGNSFAHISQGGKIVASINPNGATLGVTETQAYFNVGAIRNNGYQFFANRNITIKPATLLPAVASTVRFYFTDAEVNEMRSASGCASCTTPANYTRLNVTKITTPDKANEDGSLDNNTNGTISIIPNSDIIFVPYDAGYYAEFAVSSFSEFWLTDGGFNQPLPAHWVRFDASKQNNIDALLTWQTSNENNLLQYEPEVSANGNANFSTLGIVQAKNTNSASYQFTDNRTNKNGTQFYRIKQTDRDGNISYSATKSLRFGKANFNISTHPNPVVSVLLVKIEADDAKQFSWKITDAAGRLLLHGKQSITTDHAFLNIPMQQLPTGLFTLSVFDGTQWRQQKIVKAK